MKSSKDKSLIAAIVSKVISIVRKNHGKSLAPEVIASLKAQCDRLTPSDLGLQVPSKAQAARSKGHSIKYQHLWEDSDITVGLFILPPGATIPLHNHPEMSVVSHLLYGSLEIMSLDWCKDDDDSKSKQQNSSNSKRRRPAALRNNDDDVSCARVRHRGKVARAPTTLTLQPELCNLHQFTASEDIGCAILDILTPSYNPTQNRDCTYYELIKDDNDEDLCWLRPHIPPESFSIVTVPYNGPKIL